VIDAATLDLLRPLEEFEEIRRRAARLGDRLCDLSYANPYEGVQRGTRDVLRHALDAERLLDLQYTPFGGHTLARRAVADDLGERQRIPYAFDDVVLTPGAMAALHLALRASATPGTEVVIPVPCWLDYPLYALHLGLTPITVPLPAPEFLLDIDAIEAAITERTSAILLSNPSNPAGRSYSEDVLARLSAVIARAAHRIRREITLISDETHRDFTDAASHCPGARVHDTTLTVYSFGKYHFLQGQRVGYVAVAPGHPRRAAVAAELVRWTRVTGICTPTALMQRAIPELLALRHDLSPIDAARAWVSSELRQAGYRVTPADATLFLYIETPGAEPDFDFARRLATRGVLVLPAPVFHHSGHFRLALTGGRRMLETGVRILGTTINA